jgi:hypothetical protein
MIMAGVGLITPTPIFVFEYAVASEYHGSTTFVVCSAVGLLAVGLLLIVVGVLRLRQKGGTQ